MMTPEEFEQRMKDIAIEAEEGEWWISALAKDANISWSIMRTKTHRVKELLATIGVLKKMASFVISRNNVS